MRNKAFALILALVIALTAAGCGGTASDTPASEAPAAEATAEPTPEATPEPPKAEAAWEITDSGVTTEVNSIGTTWFRAWYQLENTGDLPLYLSTADIDIETSSGQMVKKITGMSAYPQVLLPGETGVYYEAGTLDDGAETEGLKLHGKITPVEAKVEAVRYEVEDIEVKTDSLYGTKILGRVVNDTDADTDGMVYVAVVCYDADGAFLGTMFTVLTDAIPANDYAGVEMMPFGVKIPAAAIANTVVYAYPYQFQF